MRTLALCLAVSSLAFAPMAAMAESPWTVKVGFSQVSPKSSGGDDLEVDVTKEIGLTPAIEYKFSPNVVGEVLLAIPFEHDLEDQTDGSKVGSFKHLPPTFTAKYLFTPNAAFSPYVGLGLNYTLVFSEEVTPDLKALGLDITAKDSFGVAATTGFEYRMPNSPWGVALDIRYIGIKSKVKVTDFTGAAVAEETLKVDPIVIGLSAAYHF